MIGPGGTFKFPKPTPKAKEPRPLRRKAWMRRSRPRRLDRAQSNPEFIRWLHGEECCAASLGRCSGPIEAHHAGPKPGLAMKAPDNTAVPLCRGHHAALTNHSGPFKGKTREEMRATQDEWIATSYGRFLSAGNRRTG